MSISTPTPASAPTQHSALRTPHGLGSGRLHVALVDGASSAIAIEARSPLKLLVPSPRGPAVWAFASSFGGGLVAGDHLDLGVAIGAGAAAAIGTQSSTKVYRDGVDAWAQQHVTATLGAGASLALLPDPVTPFATSRYRQRLTVDLDTDSSLLLIDSVTSGRSARAERWAFAAYDNRITVRRNGTAVLIDAMRLDDAGTRPTVERMGRFQSLSTVVMAGPRFTADTARLLAWCAAQAIVRNAPPADRRQSAD